MNESIPRPLDAERFLEWCNAPHKELNGLLRAGVVHLWFVTLHPFEDGNGRLARALTDRALAQDEQRAEHRLRDRVRGALSLVPLKTSFRMIRSVASSR